MKYKVGDIIETITSGSVKIIEIQGRIFTVQFLEDGTIVNTGASNITNKSIKNYNKKSIFGVGFIGYGENKCCINKKQTKEYRLWTDILRRVYSESHLKKHRSKSYLGCSIDEKWHNFQIFCNDLPKIKNYNKWVKFGAKKYHLDKDTIIKGNKKYSLETCMFLDVKTNCGQSSKNRESTAINVFLYKDGEKIFEGHLKEIAKILNLSYETVKARYYKRIVKDGFEIKREQIKEV